MNLVSLTSVEFLQGVRGPGPRREGETSATHATHKVRMGTTEIVSTGLVLLWDRASGAVYMLRPDAKENPCIIVGAHLVHRMLPEAFDWILVEGKTEAKAHAGR